MRSLLRLEAIAAIASTAYAQVYQYCPLTQICYSVNIPAVSASSGSGDIYFQIQAPSSTQWVALGQGEGMAGANIFMIYSDSTGQNITLSPRLGVGHVEPDYNIAAQVTLLDGTGIANGLMTANVRCSNCNSWTGGSMTFNDSSSSWIWAMRDGAAIASDSQSANVQQHDNNEPFTIDLTKATGGNSINPFVQSSTNTTGGSAPATTMTPTSGGGGSESSTQATKQLRIHAHGIIMSLSMLILFPFGALTIRVLSMKMAIWVHVGLQLFTYAFVISGMGIGVWLAVTEQAFTSTPTHPVIGLVVVSLLVLQPFLGLIHHFIYRKTQRRTVWAIAHVWYGRALLLLGAINGGLGLQLSANTTSGEIAYGVIAGVVFLIYVSVLGFSAFKSRGKTMGQTGEKATSETSPGQSVTTVGSNDGER